MTHLKRSLCNACRLQTQVWSLPMLDAFLATKYLTCGMHMKHSKCSLRRAYCLQPQIWSLPKLEDFVAAEKAGSRTLPPPTVVATLRLASKGDIAEPVRGLNCVGQPEVCVCDCYACQDVCWGVVLLRKCSSGGCSAFVVHTSVVHLLVLCTQGVHYCPMRTNLRRTGVVSMPLSLPVEILAHVTVRGVGFCQTTSAYHWSCHATL
eukprot:1160453-Pelagomonas_calceolata.AAC.16